MNYKVISIDIAKNVFQVCALDHHHKVGFNKKVSRARLLDTVRQLECDYVVMEACYERPYMSWTSETVSGPNITSNQPESITWRVMTCTPMIHNHLTALRMT